MRFLLVTSLLFLAGCVSPAERARALNPDTRPAATVVIGSALLVPGETRDGTTLAEVASAAFADRQRFILRATGNEQAMALLCSEKDAVDSAIWREQTEIVLPDLVFLTREPALAETEICQARDRFPVFERIANYTGGLENYADISGVYAVWAEDLARDNATWFLNHVRDNSAALLAGPAYAPHFQALQ
ncbi:MAG: hypothetical protein AAFV19_09145 [Pseudomonadota bacterium]